LWEILFNAKRVIFASRVSDPDPHGSAFKLLIRIQEGKKDPQKWKKVQNFHVFKYWIWMFSFEG
jgi:hypothetical protein